HYTGMMAMQMNATIAYDPLLFTVSVVIAVTAATVALWLAFNVKSLWSRLAAALVMGAAIAAMHYTGMAATTFTPIDMATQVPISSASPYFMALAVGAATIVILALGIVACWSTATLRSTRRSTGR
ncbi:MAG: MHYT domain-containing protein, partial [Dongiaceae bacterium]